MISYIYYWVHIDECSRIKNPLQEKKMNDSENINTHLLRCVSNALAKYAIPDFTGGFSARIGGWDIAVPADGNLVTLGHTAAGVYTTLPWEYAVEIDFSGDTLVFRDSAGAITADIKIEVNP